MSQHRTNNNIPTFSHDPSPRRFRSRPRPARQTFSRFPVQDPHQTTDDAINFEAYDSVPVEATGNNIPPPVNTFSQTDLEQRLKRNIQRCNYVKPTPVQRHAIPIATAGRDLMACAQTGSGFSSLSRGPALAYPTALILSPTRELSCQISDEAIKFAYQTGVKVVVAYGGAPINHQLRLLDRGVDILVATPGRLVDIIERERVSLTRIKYLALDEADRMLDMGFEHQIRKIVQQMHMPPPGIRQTLLFSATFPNDIQKLASDFLSDYVFLSVGRVGSSTELIEQKIELVQDMDKRDHLYDHLCRQMAHGANGKHALTLVFVETKRGADALENWMLECGFGAVAIHGDKVQMERERALRSFKSGLTPILVATDVASRGLDIPHVSHVINYDLPREIDSYVHRIGRTGRAGKSGLATAFFSDKNSPIAKALVGLLQEAKQEVPSWLNGYAEYSPSGSGGGHGRGYGSQRSYGGRDFRNVTEPEVQNYNGYSTYGSAEYTDTSYDMQNSNIESSFDSLNITSAASYNHTHVNSITSVASYNHTDVNSGDVCGSIRVQEDGPCGYSTIVATGWD